MTNTFSITNSGNIALNISGVTTSGVGATCFSLQNLPSVISTSSVSNFSVVFTPQGGQQVAQFALTHDGTNSPFAINVTGFGSGGEIQLATNWLTYSGVYAGTDSLTQAVGMANVGVGAFHYTNLITYSAGASGWLVVSPDAGTVAQGEATTLTNAINLAGVNAGTYYATNRVTALDATNSPQDVCRDIDGRAWESDDHEFPESGDADHDE